MGLFGFLRRPSTSSAASVKSHGVYSIESKGGLSSKTSGSTATRRSTHTIKTSPAEEGSLQASTAQISTVSKKSRKKQSASTNAPPTTIVAKTSQRSKPRKTYFTEESTKTLDNEIKEFLGAFAANLDPKDLQIIAETTRDLCDMHIAERSLKVNDHIPMFALPDPDGNKLSIEDMTQQRDYTVIIFYRGNWCPFCNMELMAYQRTAEYFSEENVGLVAISPNLPDVSKNMKQAKKLDFTVLSDVGNVVAKQFGIVYEMAQELRPIFLSFGSNIPEENGDTSYELPLVSKFVVDDKGKIIFSHIEADFTKRPEPEEILQKIMDYDMQRPMDVSLSINME